MKMHWLLKLKMGCWGWLCLGRAQIGQLGKWIVLAVLLSQLAMQTRKERPLLRTP